jgi:hypothetical protein
METLMRQLPGHSTLETWLRRARVGALLPGLAFGVILGCSAGTSTTAPTISAISPTYGTYGTAVTVTGKGFSDSLKNVYFDGIGATTGTYTSDTSVTVDVPAAAVTGPISVVTSGGTASFAQEFIVVPSFTSISPDTGEVGTLVTIAGYGLEGVNAITITGYSGTIAPISKTANQITFDVPAGATVDQDTITLGNSYGAVAPAILISFTVKAST